MMLMIACLPLSSSLHVAFTSILSVSVAVCLSDMSILMNVSERSFSQVCSTSLRLEHSKSPSQPTTNTPQQSTPLPSNHTHNPQKQTSNHITHPHHPNKRAKKKQAKHTQHNIAQKIKNKCTATEAAKTYCLNGDHCCVALSRRCCLINVIAYDMMERPKRLASRDSMVRGWSGVLIWSPM